MKLDPGFPSHWKTERLIARCGVGAAFGLLRLWGTCQVSRRWSGLDLTPAKLAAVMRYEGDPAELWAAMTDSVGPWLDAEEGGTWTVHDFDHHQRQTIALWENGRKGGRPPKSPPAPSPNTNTLTNTHTLTPLGSVSEPLGFEPKPNGFSGMRGFSVEACIEAGKLASIPEDVCRAYHDDREGGGWIDGKGRRVTSMPHDLAGFWRKWQSNRNQHAAGGGRKPASVWELTKAAEAIDKEIGVLTANPANKHAPDPSAPWETRLRPEVKAKLAELKTRAADLRQRIALAGQEAA
jgi:hypothetical protein